MLRGPSTPFSPRSSPNTAEPERPPARFHFPAMRCGRTRLLRRPPAGGLTGQSISCGRKVPGRHNSSRGRCRNLCYVHETPPCPRRRGSPLHGLRGSRQLVSCRPSDREEICRRTRRTCAWRSPKPSSATFSTTPCRGRCRRSSADSRPGQCALQKADAGLSPRGICRKVRAHRRRKRSEAPSWTRHPAQVTGGGAWLPMPSPIYALRWTGGLRSTIWPGARRG